MFETSLELYLLLKGDSFFANIENEKFEKNLFIPKRSMRIDREKPNYFFSFFFFFNLIFRMN